MAPAALPVLASEVDMLYHHRRSGSELEVGRLGQRDGLWTHADGKALAFPGNLQFGDLVIDGVEMVLVHDSYSFILDLLYRTKVQIDL